MLNGARSAAPAAKTVTIGYKASPTFADFHASDAFVRGMRGPVGSGKSVGSCVELALIKSIAQQPNAAGFRKTRWAFVRATYPELKSTTIKTFQDWVPESLCPLKMNDSPITGLLTLPLPDGTCVLAEFLFLALDKPKDLGKVLSLEITGAFLNEAKEVDKAVADALTSRCGRYPSKRDGGPTWTGMVMDTNSPDEDHWYAELEQNPPEGWEFFVQPPALIRDKKDPRGFKPNPKAENIENLPGGYQYYYNSIGGKDSNWIRAYVLNEYATVRMGKPVYEEDFNDEVHVSNVNLWPVAGKTVYIGMDFGLTPAAVFGQFIDGQLRILDELCATRMGLENFIVTALAPLIAEKYAKHERIFVGDPSGNKGADTDEKSCFEVMGKFGMPCVGASTNNIQPRLDAVRHFCNRMAYRGQPALLVSPHCRTVKDGFINGYQFERVQVSGEARYRDKPEKKSKYSHPHDALQYLCLRVLTAINRNKRSAPRAPQHRAADRTTGY